MSDWLDEVSTVVGAPPAAPSTPQQYDWLDEVSKPVDAAPKSYDTKLSQSDERSFQDWKQQHAPNDSGEDYDLRGAFKAGVTPGDNGHWPDTYKKPNHPTFSVESQYAKDRPELAGHWEGEQFIPPDPKATSPQPATKSSIDDLRYSRDIATKWPSLSAEQKTQLVQADANSSLPSMTIRNRLTPDQNLEYQDIASPGWRQRQDFGEGARIIGEAEKNLAPPTTEEMEGVGLGSGIASDMAVGARNILAKTAALGLRPVGWAGEAIDQATNPNYQPSPSSPADDINHSTQRIAQQQAAIYKKHGQNPLAHQVVTGVTELIGELAATGGAGAASLPTFAAEAGLTSANSALTDAKDAGLSGPAAAAYAVTTGGLTSLITMLVPGFASRFGTDALAGTVRAAMKEVPKKVGETVAFSVLAPMVQKAVDATFSVDEDAFDPDKLLESLKHSLITNFAVLGVAESGRVVNVAGRVARGFEQGVARKQAELDSLDTLRASKLAEAQERQKQATAATSTEAQPAPNEVFDIPPPPASSEVPPSAAPASVPEPKPTEVAKADPRELATGWAQSNPDRAATLAEKVASGEGISRADFEKAGLSSVGTNAQQRAEFAGHVREWWDQQKKPTEVAAEATPAEQTPQQPTVQEQPPANVEAPAPQPPVPTDQPAPPEPIVAPTETTPSEKPGTGVAKNGVPENPTGWIVHIPRFKGGVDGHAEVRSVNSDGSLQVVGGSRRSFKVKPEDVKFVEGPTSEVTAPVHPPVSESKPATTLTAQGSMLDEHKAEWKKMGASEQEIAEMDEPVFKGPSGSDPKDGQPIEATAYRGTGRTNQASIYGKDATGPALGPGIYWAATEQQAKRYGSEITKGTVNLEKPFVISNDAQLTNLANTANLPYDNASRAKVLTAAVDKLKQRGYDGVIVNLHSADSDSEGKSNKRLREIFDHTQIVDFKPQVKVASFTLDRPLLKANEGDTGDTADVQAMAAQPNPTGQGPQKGVRFSRGAPEIPVQMEPSAGADQSAQEIVSTMSKLFSVPIRSGRVSLKQALGIYKQRPEVIRTLSQSSADLAVTSHEVAHHIDKKTDVRKLTGTTPEERGKIQAELKALDYDPTAGRTSEGFAEFVRHYLTTDEAKDHAPIFHRYFEGWLAAHPDMQKKFEQIRSMADRWRQQGAMGRADAAISETGIQPGPVQTWKARAKDALEDYKRGFWRSMLDENYVLSLVDQDVKASGRALKPGESWAADMYGALTHAGPSMAARSLEEGVHSVVTGKKIGSSLKEYLAPIPEKDYAEFRRYLWARHALEVYSKNPNMNPGISKADAQYIVNEASKDKAKQERFEVAADGVTQFNRDLLTMLVEAGVVTPESANKMVKKWQTYIPLFRAQDTPGLLRGGMPKANKLVDLPEAIRRRHGSGRQILDPVNSTIQQAAYFFDRALKQQSLLQLLRETDPMMGGAEGMGGWVERIPPVTKPTAVNLGEVWPAIADRLKQMGIDGGMHFDPEFMKEMGEEFANDWVNIWRPDYSSVPGKYITRSVVNGQPINHQLNEDLYKAVIGSDRQSLPWFLKIIQSGVKALKMGATELNPAFVASNAVRDWITFQHQTQSKQGLKSTYSPFMEIGRYIASELSVLGYKPGRSDEAVQLWKELGGKLATRYGLDQAELTGQRRELMGFRKKRTLGEKLILPIHNMRAAINVSEVGPRLSEFVSVLKQHGYTRKDGKIVNASTGQPERPPMNVMVEAIKAANEVTVNFGRMGKDARVLNQFIPFFNAAVQGQLSRAEVLGGAARGAVKGLSGQAKEGRERQWKRVAVMLAMAAAGTAAYWMLRHDDDDYKAEESWLKYGYWAFTDSDGNPIIRVTKGYEYSFVPSITEAILNSVVDKDPKAAQEALRYELGTALPGAGPAVVTPVVEWLANYDFFRGKPIENTHMKSLMPGDRSAPYTTELMKAIGNYLNVSPVQLEHFVDSTTGGAYRHWYGMGERAVKGKITASDTPLSGFTIRKDYPADVDDFYNEQNKLGQEYNSATKKGEVPSELSDRYHQFNEASEIMHDLRGLLDGKTERAERFAIEKYIVGLSRFALGREDLKRYPNPLYEPDADLPPEVVDIKDKYFGKLAKRLERKMPEWKPGKSREVYEKQMDSYYSLRDRARKVMDSASAR